MKMIFSKPNRFIALLSWFFVFAWMIVIFSLSSQPAKTSNQLSKGVTKEIMVQGARVGVIEPGLGNKTSSVDAFNNKLREYAHASVYFVLALFVLNAFNRSDCKGSKAIVYSFLLCAGYALTDELHQLFVTGRGAELIDFTLDSTGALLGLGLFSFVAWIVRLGKCAEV